VQFFVRRPFMELIMSEPEYEEGPCIDNEGVPTEMAVLRRFWMNRNTRVSRNYSVGETLRMPHYETAGGFRVWKVVGVHLGGEKQEGTYHLRPLDLKDNAEIHVPCIVLETHPEIESV